MEYDNKTLLDKPLTIAEIKTGHKLLTGVSCVSGEEVWTCGLDNLMNLYNPLGVLVRSFQTRSGSCPESITVTKSGDLVYTDIAEKTVNILNNSQIHTLVKKWGWHPHSICSTSSDDLLVVMHSDDDKQSKGVRYSGSTEKQVIQYV